MPSRFYINRAAPTETGSTPGKNMNITAAATSTAYIMNTTKPCLSANSNPANPTTSKIAISRTLSSTRVTSAGKKPVPSADLYATMRFMYINTMSATVRNASISPSRSTAFSILPPKERGFIFVFSPFVFYGIIIAREL